MDTRESVLIAALVIAVPVAVTAAVARHTAPIDRPQALDAARVLVESSQRHHPRSEEYLGEVIVISKEGKERRKTWRSYRNGPAGNADRFIRLLTPADVRGVGYLAHYRSGKAPEEWLYLPSMGRERRIVASDRDAAFAGTTFTYEDLDQLDFDPTRYDARLLPPESADGAPVFVVAMTPRVASAYTKRVVRLRQDTLDVVDESYFVAGVDGPAKRLSMANYQVFDGYRVAARVEMADLRKGSRTVVVLHEVKLDRPQPSDRYTLQNLVRETGGGAPAPGSFQAPRLSDDGVRFGALTETRAPGAFGGSLEMKALAPWSSRAGSPTVWPWGTAVFRATPTSGRVAVDVSARFEASASPFEGAVTFDPADRKPARSPISLRTLAMTVSPAPGIDIVAGRFNLTWGTTDGYSPADAFLPRDYSDPLSEERLPLWGADVRVQRGRVRYEFLAVPVLTPWRLLLDGRQLHVPSSTITFAEPAWSVPTTGFGATRVRVTANEWDVGGWYRAGHRPAPVLVTDLKLDAPLEAPVTATLTRRFTTEQSGGISIGHAWGGWVITSELGVSASPDASVGRAVTWTLGASRVVRNGIVTATLAGNAAAFPVNPLLLPDRALLPLVILGAHQDEHWGHWRLVWVGTFHTVGGVLTAELTRSITPAVAFTAGADLPHGAPLSPAVAFAGRSRLRLSLRVLW